jgi:intraflagellar transport protein 172
MENNLKQAEHHYIESSAWNYAVDMYRAHDMWEEALRVAKTNGTVKELAEIAIKVAETMGAEKGT